MELLYVRKLSLLSEKALQHIEAHLIAEMHFVGNVFLRADFDDTDVKAVKYFSRIRLQLETTSNVSFGQYLGSLEVEHYHEHDARREKHKLDQEKYVRPV